MNARSLLSGAALAAFVLLCVIPPLLLLGSAFHTEHGIGLDRFSNLLLDHRQLGLLKNSIFVGFGTAVFATLIGAPLGYLIGRTNLPLRGLLGVLCAAPLIVPPYVTGIAYTVLRTDLEALFRGALPVPTLAGIGGTWFLETISLFPLVTLLAAQGFASVDGTAEEAAGLARGKRSAFFRVTLPLAAPAIACGAVFVFVFAVCDFSIPDYLSFTGPPDRVYQVFATEVFYQFSKMRSSEDAAVASLPLLVIVAIALPLLLRFEGSAERAVSGQLRVAPRERRLGAWRWPAFAFALAVAAVATVIPLAELARWTAAGGSQENRLDAILAACSDAAPDIGRSILLSAGAGLTMAVIGFLLAYRVERSQTAAGSRRLAAFLLLPVAVPSILLAIGEIRFWNHPLNPLADWVYPSPILVLITYVARFLPFAILIARAQLKNLDPQMEEAARIAGKRFPAILCRVVLPAAVDGFLGAMLVGFLLSMRELDAVVLLPAGSDTLPNRVYSLVHTQRDAVVAALCLVLVLSAAVPLLVYRFVLARRLRLW